MLLEVALLIFSIIVITAWSLISLYRKRKVEQLPNISDDNFYLIFHDKYPHPSFEDVQLIRQHIGDIMNIPYEKISPLMTIDQLKDLGSILSDLDLEALFSEIDGKSNTIETVADYINRSTKSKKINGVRLD